jgi:hypothetical protein
MRNFVWKNLEESDNGNSHDVELRSIMSERHRN